MIHPQDLQRIQQQEQALRFSTFGFDHAWALGEALRRRATEEGKGIVVDVRLFPDHQLFYTALPGTTPDHLNWVRRKSNVVRQFHRSSYGVGQGLRAGGNTITQVYALPEEDYAIHGGSFPILLESGVAIGSITVSGLPQREDHEWVVWALCTVLGQDVEALKLD